MDNELKKSYWSDAAKKGGIIGLLFFLLSFIDGVFQLDGARGIILLLQFIILAVFIYRFGRDRALKHGNEGFSYGQSMGYILAMMIFAGLVYGIGEFFLENYIAVDYFNEKYEQVLYNTPTIDPDTELGRETISLFMEYRRKIMFIMTLSMFTMLFYGGLVGLLASAFVRRRPDVFTDTDTDSDRA